MYSYRIFLPDLIMEDDPPKRNTSNLSHKEIVQATSLINNSRSQQGIHARLPAKGIIPTPKYQVGKP